MPHRIHVAELIERLTMRGCGGEPGGYELSLAFVEMKAHLVIDVAAESGRQKVRYRRQDGVGIVRETARSREALRA